MRRLETALVALALALLALGVALLPLELPVFTRALVERHAQLEAGIAVPLGEAARSFVVSGDDASRAVVASIMTADAVVHLDDVRRVLVAADAATLVLVVVVGAWSAFCLARGRRLELARGLRAGGVLSAALVVVAGLVALIDFDTFFSAFHGLFFEPGTWQFPSDSVLIRLFPEPFWTSAGLAWALLVLLIAAAYGLIGGAVTRSVTNRSEKPAADNA
jgi:integral membrane protein (TIGR01906 family)